MRKMKTNKYLYLLPIVVCLAFLLFFNSLAQHIEQERHNLIFENRKEMVDLIASEIDHFVQRDGNWHYAQSFYIDWLLFSRDFANLQAFTISVLMDEDLNLLQNEIHTNEDPRYQIFLSQDFKSGLSMVGFGNMEIYFEGSTLSVHYRWIPENQDNQLLIAIGVAQEVGSALTYGFTVGIGALILFVLIVNYAMLWKILKQDGGGK